MVNKFAMVGISGLVVCAICLAAAAAIGGKVLHDGFDFDFSGLGRPRCDFESSGKSASRSIDWKGGDSVGIQLPATVHYRQGSGEKVLVNGDSAVLPHIRVVNGEIRMDCRGADYGNQLDITLPGRAFDKFSMAGTGSLTLENIDRPDLKIEMAGHTDVTASGKTGDLKLEMAGSNQARLDDLATDDAKVELAGSNDVEVSTRDDLKVEIAGRGDVKLRVEPRHLLRPTLQVPGTSSIPVATHPESRLWLS